MIAMCPLQPCVTHCSFRIATCQGDGAGDMTVVAETWERHKRQEFEQMVSQGGATRVGAALLPDVEAAIESGSHADLSGISPETKEDLCKLMDMIRDGWYVVNHEWMTAEVIRLWDAFH